MPCWYFERREIKNSPSYKDGMDCNTESRYRREGARFILDAGTKLGLRYDTCATGVVYFHRFYMFHSFKEFYRYVTAACCLFLAGKVEETPKKCKDIIKTAQSLLSPSSFQRFGEDPREEVMMMERILLKTIKFDLQVEHPYGVLIKYLKHFKGEKDKTQKMAQMAWTFINDSLCTTLSLQWEPEITAVSLMYLASRLTKFDPSDWSGRSSSKTKWWEDFVEGMSMELMEDICHQVLDLYSKQSKKGLDVDSPPQSPAKASRTQDSPPPPPPPDKTPGKRSREVTPSEPERESKVMKQEKEAKSSSTSKTSSSSTASSTAAGAPIPVAQHITSKSSSHSSYSSMDAPTTDFNSYNPYVSSQMYSASFMSQEGSQNIQSILAGSSAPPPSAGPVYSDPHHASRHAPPPSVVAPDASQYPPPAQVQSEAPYSYPPPSQPSYIPPPTLPPPPHSYPPPTVTSSAPPYDPYSLPPNPAAYPPPSYPPPVTQPPPQGTFPPPGLPPPHYSGYPYPPGSHPQGHVPPPNIPPPGLGPPPHGASYPPPSSAYSSQPPPGSSQPPNYGPSRHHGNNYNNKQGKKGRQQRKDIPSLTEIKISGRPEWGHPK